MNYPADQDQVAASDIEPGFYIFIPGGWTPVAEVVTADGHTTVTLGPVVFDADEQVPVCMQLNIAKPRRVG